MVSSHCAYQTPKQLMRFAYRCRWTHFQSFISPCWCCDGHKNQLHHLYAHLTHFHWVVVSGKQEKKLQRRRRRRKKREEPAAAASAVDEDDDDATEKKKKHQIKMCPLLYMRAYLPACLPAASKQAGKYPVQEFRASHSSLIFMQNENIFMMWHLAYILRSKTH